VTPTSNLNSALALFLDAHADTVPSLTTTTTTTTAKHQHHNHNHNHNHALSIAHPHRIPISNHFSDPDTYISHFLGHEMDES
jgi:hypothetical protein